jgi:hypothetical protein
MADTSSPATKVQSFLFAMVYQAKSWMWQSQVWALHLTVEMLLPSSNLHLIEWRHLADMPIAMDAVAVIFSM